MLWLYVLDDDGVPRREPDTLAWAHWYAGADRCIGSERIGDLFVSTVFLGVDQTFGRGARPVLFETMVFYGRSAVVRERCGGDVDHARAMHTRICADVRAGTVQPWGVER